MKNLYLIGSILLFFISTFSSCSKKDETSESPATNLVIVDGAGNNVGGAKCAIFKRLKDLRNGKNRVALVTSGSDGKVSFKGLNEGTKYYISVVGGTNGNINNANLTVELVAFMSVTYQNSLKRFYC